MCCNIKSVLNDTSKKEVITMNLLRVNEVAEMLRSTPQTVYRLTRNNELPHIKIGGMILFNEETLIDYHQKLENTSKKEVKK